jgi:hypothetical protein
MDQKEILQFFIEHPELQEIIDRNFYDEPLKYDIRQIARECFEAGARWMVKR